MAYSTDAFLDTLYRKALAQETLADCRDDAAAQLLEQKRSRLRSVLCLDRLEALAQSPVCLPVEVRPLGGHRLEQHDLRFLPGLTAPLWVVRPATPNGAWVLYCHGHDRYGAKGSFLELEAGVPYHKRLPLHLADRGFTVVIPELIGFGDTVENDFLQRDEAGCYANCTALLLHGLNMAGLRVFEVQRVLDWMTEQGARGVGVHGISGGGLVASYLAAVDRRPAAVAVAGYTNTFRRSILSMLHCIDNFTPGILSVGECPEIIALAAPTPLLISAGKDDPIFPLEGTRQAVEHIRRVYHRLGKEDLLKVELFDGEHEISLGAVFPFFTETLISSD